MSVCSVSAGNPKNNDMFIDDPTTIEMDIEAVNTSKSKGVKPVDLAKVWRINVETARRTIEVTTQGKQQDADGFCLETSLRTIVCFDTDESIPIFSPIRSLSRRKPGLLVETRACSCLFPTKGLCTWCL